MSDHPFVLIGEILVASKRADFTERVKSGRMTKEHARTEFDKLEALLEFLKASNRRFTAEEKYDMKRRDLDEDIAHGNTAARDIWFKWSTIPKEQNNAEH